MPRNLIPSRIPARFHDFTTPDARSEFPTSNFQRVLDAVVTTEVLNRDYYLEPSDVLTASDVGSVAQIEIASFVVNWPDIPAVAYQGATIGSLAFSTIYGVYLDDTDRDGKPDTCLFVTTDISHFFDAPGRIFLGSVTTPADGGADVPGGGGAGGGGPSEGPKGGWG